MSNYFDNQPNWAWSIHDGKAFITTDHGSHSHTLDVSKASIGELADPKSSGKVLGDAHRAATHDKKTPNLNAEGEGMSRSSFLDSLRVDARTQAELMNVSKNFKAEAKTTAKGKDQDGGRERGDEGPGSHGRDSGNKPNSSVKAPATSKGGNTAGKGGNGLSGFGHSGSGTNGGHGGHGGKGGHGGGGNGGSGGGHGR